MLDAVSARMGPASFAAYLDPRNFRAPPHIRLLSKEIRNTIVEGGRLIVSMPPRHGKSHLSSFWTPHWFLDTWPEKRFGVISYGADFAAEWGRAVRNCVEMHQDKSSVRIAQDSAAADNWSTLQKGGMITTGVGGVLRGRGLHVANVDDPVKNAEEARSKLHRDKLWKWYVGTLRDRIEPNGAIIVVMTRAHEDDFVGRLQSPEFNPGYAEWRHLCIRAVAEDDDPLGRKPGEALWPERYDEAALARIKRDLPAWEWETLFQQRPAPEEGAMFRRDHVGRFVTEENNERWRLSNGKYVNWRDAWVGQTVDTAMEEDEESDWTVVLTFAVGPRGEILVLDVARARLEVPDQWGFVVTARRKWDRWPNFRFTGIEDKNSGTVLLQIAKRNKEHMLALEPGNRDKVTRAAQAAVTCQNGLLFLPSSAPWLGPFEGELYSFPKSAHDDQVDCLSYAAQEAKGLLLGNTSGRRPRTNADNRYGVPHLAGTGLASW